jgi:subfamily B ATP-binding cassette protein MsbA
VNPLHRLFGYARPYRGRFAVALAAMVVYAAATAAVAALIQPVIDHVLPERRGLSTWSIELLLVYLVKGLAGYASAFVMTDIAARTRLRDRLFRHILDQSATFFSRHTPAAS